MINIFFIHHYLSNKIMLNDFKYITYSDNIVFCNEVFQYSLNFILCFVNKL